MGDGELIERVWEYPLFKALAQRRGNRVGLGYEVSDARFPYKSEKTPVPLSELETALLCWAGHGINGIGLHDQNLTGSIMLDLMSWNGRTHATTCSNRHSELLVINDEGMFFYRPKDAVRLWEVETAADCERTLSTFKEAKVKLTDTRPELPSEAFTFTNRWDANKPGATIFLPFSDVTEECINLLLYFCGFPPAERCQFFDGRTGKPAGCQKWIDNGFLKGPKLILQDLEGVTAKATVAMNYFISQNIALAATAMGLGHLIWSGFVALILMGGTPLTRGLGFRFVTGKDRMPTPVGIDGFLEAWCPPYFKDMSAAIDDILNLKYGPQGLFTPGYPGKRPFLDTEKAVSNYPKVSEEAVECVKDICNYVYETYGRYPASVDAWEIPIAVTVHHVDLDFYDKYYPHEVMSKEKRVHMELWHKGE